MFKKVLILCFSENMGGMEIDAVKMSQRVSFYAQVTMIGVSGSPIEKMASDTIANSKSFNYFGCKINRFLARALIEPRIVHVIRSVVNEQDPDLVIFFGTSEVKSIALALFGKRTKLVLRLGTTINNPKKSLFQRFTYGKVDGFLALGPHIENNIRESFNLSANQVVRVIYPVYKENKLSNNFLNPQPDKKTNLRLVRSDKISIIYHSRFVEGKGQLDAVKAVHILTSKYQNLNLKLIGSFEDQKYVDKIEAYTRENRLTKNISLLNNQSNINDFLADSDFFIFPSFGEGFPNALVEALMHGLVCVTYDNTAFPYFKKMGFDIITSKTGNVEELSSSIAIAIQKYLSGSIKIEHNIALAKKQFTGELEKLTLTKLYSEIIVK